MAEDRKKVVALATKAKEQTHHGRDDRWNIHNYQWRCIWLFDEYTHHQHSNQSAILGMHKIQERPMAINGQVVIKPMMYLALSYDHRIVDGRESVSFLVRVKELLENPAQLLFGKDPLKALLEL